MTKTTISRRSLDDAHVLVHPETGRVALWKRGTSPVAPLFFANEKLARKFHRRTLRRDPEWKVERATNVLEVLPLTGGYLRRKDGTDAFIPPLSAN